MRDCREKPRENHTWFSSKKTTEVRLVLQLCELVGTNRLCQKQGACCRALRGAVRSALLLERMQAKISTRAKRLRVFGESLLCWRSCKRVVSSREGSWGSISKTKLQLGSQRIRKKLFYVAMWIKSSERNKTPDVSTVLCSSDF